MDRQEQAGTRNLGTFPFNLKQKESIAFWFTYIENSGSCRPAVSGKLGEGGDSMACHYSIHIQICFQFSLLPIDVIENRQLMIKKKTFSYFKPFNIQIIVSLIFS